MLSTQTALRFSNRQLVRMQLRCLAVDPEAPKRKQQKAKKKKKGASSSSSTGDDSMASKNMKMVMAALDAPMKQEPAISDEEKGRRYTIGRNYVIGCFREHNQIDHDLTCKIHMKKHAVKMLPRNSPVRDAALAINTSMPPPWRQLPVWTPPIPGFDPSQFVERVEEED